MPPREHLGSRVDAIEEAYEFFLAYAAQGVSGDQASRSGGQLRDLMRKAATALAEIAGCVREVVDGERLEPAGAWADMVAVLEEDAEGAAAAVRLVLSRDSISSQLVDNLNANIHLRAVLTDIFLLDEALDSRSG